MYQIISLCFICDENYVMPTAVAITSVIHNKSSATCYDIYLVANNLSDKSIEIFKKMETDSARIIIIKTADSDKFEKFRNDHYCITSTALYKFELPELLPVDLEKVLYMDGDIIVQKDLAPIFNEDIEDVYAGVVVDYNNVIDPDSFQKLLNVKHKEYFNTGVLLLNLQRMREDHVSELLFQYRTNHNDRYMDQDTFNIVLKENVKYLSFFYNFQYHCWIYNTKKLADYYGIRMVKSKYEWIQDALILHYTYFKPWKYFDYFAADIWLHYYLLSPFKNISLVRESQNRERIAEKEKEITELKLAIMQQKAGLTEEKEKITETELKNKKNCDTPMKIAIWGYGGYGRRMFESLTRFCSEEYEVVRVYDTAYRKFTNIEKEQPLQIHSPEELPEDYKNGLFEKVLLCIFLEHTKPRQFLRMHSIPELHLGSPDDFCPISSFEQGEKPFEINRDGYDFYVVKNLYGAMTNYESHEQLFLFDLEGRVVKEHDDFFASNSSFMYDYPFVFKHSKAEKTYLDGQYCILTKKYSGNYWHFTYNSLDIVWLLEKAGFKGKYVVPNRKFCSEILRMLDVPPERIITISAFEHNKIFVFEEVFYVVYTMPNDKEKINGVPVLLEAAEYIKKKLPVDPSLPKKIYIKRIGKRKLLGADDNITEYGFTTIVLEHYSVWEQMKLFFNADIVFCVHGANSTNCLYMRKDTVFIEAFSSYWINRCNLYAIAASGVRYFPISPLETVWVNKDGMSKDFEIPESMLRMTIQNAFLVFRAEHDLTLLK